MAAIAVMGAVAFAGGFALLWTLGSWIVGGSGAGPGSDAGGAVAAAVASAQTDYTVEPLVDLMAFRDLSYVPIKGVYMTGYSAGSAEAVKRLVGLADRTEVNAFVINVKDDDGTIMYETTAPMAADLDTDSTVIGDIDGLLATMAEHDIIPIARIVCFKDNVLPNKRTDLAVLDSRTGEPWKDNGRAHSTYLNPYNHEVWEYLVQVAEDAARRGFREIQFDYVRFPTDGEVKYLEFPGQYCTREDAIAGFLAYARPRLEKAGVWVSADVFGLVLAHPKDNSPAQNLEKICRSVDILCPMVYPDLYDAGSYDVANPNSSPYAIVSGAMKDMAARLPGLGTKGRPWLRDYDWRGVVYGAKEVQAEMRAASEQGFNEWILWNSSNQYTEDALQPQ
jgi:hypothetical protein